MLGLGGLGIALLTAALYLATQPELLSAERLLTVAGSLALIAAHTGNQRHCGRGTGACREPHAA